MWTQSVVVYYSRAFYRPCTSKEEGPMAIQKVGIVGCGVMGRGIAQTCAQADYGRR